MADLTEFKQYYQLTDKLIAGATRGQLAECARLLALNLAHYQAKYGEMPLDESLAMINAAEPNEKQAVLLRDGMKVFVGVLGGVLSRLGEERH